MKHHAQNDPEAPECPAIARYEDNASWAYHRYRARGRDEEDSERLSRKYANLKEIQFKRNWD